MIIVNGLPLTIITKRSILDVAAVLDALLNIIDQLRGGYYLLCSSNKNHGKFMNCCVKETNKHF